MNEQLKQLAELLVELDEQPESRMYHMLDEDVKTNLYLLLDEQFHKVTDEERTEMNKHIKLLNKKLNGYIVNEWNIKWADYKAHYH